MAKTTDLDAVYRADDDLFDAVRSFCWNVLDNAKDEDDAREGIEETIEREVESMIVRLHRTLDDVVEEWWNQDCESCEGCGECPDCDWMRRDNPEGFSREIAECGSCGGTGECYKCGGSGREFPE